MAKVISYKFLSCEIEHEIIVEVPLLDEDGNPVVNEIKNLVTEEVTIPVLNEMGEPLLDEEGQPIVEVITRPVYDENGEPVYDITYEPVMTTETRVEVEQVILDKSIICPTQAIYDANYPIAEKEAVGEITVTGEFDPEPETPSGDSVWDELDAAYQRGVDSV
jgi:hypothetical protein